MAFNFFGTYTTGQYNEFRSFSKVQESDIKKRITHVEVMLTKFGSFNIDYNQSSGYPTSVTCAGNDSYGAKLLRAYVILGGVPERDMVLRLKNDPVFLKKGTDINTDGGDPNSGYGSEYSDKRLDRGHLVFDRDLGTLINRQKNWQLQAIKRKRESLEFKIKRILYLSESLKDERAHLTSMLEDLGRNNLNMISSRVQAIQLEPGRMNVIDNDEDLYGMGIGREYDPTVDGEDETAIAYGERGFTP